MSSRGEEELQAPSSAPPLRPRKRPRRDEIVAEATRLFAERGYEGTSMGDLAACVGLRKASLFHHFESKDTLYATVLTQLVDSVGAAMFAAMAAEGSFVERLDRLSEAITGILGAEPHAARLLMREAMDWGPVVRTDLGVRIQAVLEAAVEFVSAGQREGVFDPALDARQLVITTIGAHFIPFVIDRTVEAFVGQSPFGQPFIEARKRCVRDQVRSVMLVPALR